MSTSTRNRACGPSVVAWADDEEASVAQDTASPVWSRETRGIKFHTPTQPPYEKAVFDKALGKHFDSSLLTKDLDPQKDALIVAKFNLIRLKFNMAIREVGVGGMSFHDKCNMIDIQRIYCHGKPDSQPYIRVVLRKRKDWMNVAGVLNGLRLQHLKVPIRYHLTFGAQQQQEKPKAVFS
ncbi:hypothetical protein D6C97_06927 [Aureobasidium pullulans]|nr:hypothetical protein D6D27_07292 [Aureobasidium pullulans]THY50728.1 hypothetical protein D6C97_06927 [Aureobasidium pullulans]